MKVCIITGVTRERGLGYAITRLMFQRGYIVYIGGRNGDSAAELAARLDKSGKKVRPSALDITDDGSVSQFYSKVMEEEGVVDALINNAGGGFDAGQDPLAVNFSEARSTFETNLFGAWRMIRRAVPLLMNSQAPCVVNVSSGAGTFGDPVFGMAHHPQQVPAYALSKLALNGLTVKLAGQLGAYGIMVNAVDPGLVATYPGMEKIGAADPKDAAVGVVWAATLPKGGPNGQLFRNGKVTGW
ncbi:MAG TPA: SDR family NAD(P)-dependent oxidoreductase [Puia sp.]|uniref:SDR family NAD(P)-dependent oxidoreductase n=1 Tax=Puia sp. TaxID=2045100 RepID=UPI002B816786|nr:SDR family NAD(P)-dependent oxidoreductase [Puia sp.]HVU94857.1 SDR family NAD(P)-dependent oxidoreductase [Puia sp.]